MVKRKMKKAIRQKQKVKVSQNVKVVIGDIKKKRAVKSSGAKAGAKPPLVLNISNPQPLNNMFMEYFKKQLQNQEPIKANTLAQQEASNEREETKASKAGALHRLDQDPGKDQERELKRQKIEQMARFQKAEAEKKSQEAEMTASFKKLPKEPKQTNIAPKLKKPAITPPLFQTEQQQAIAESIASNLEQQQSEMESLITNPFEAMEEEETRFFPVPSTSPSLNLPPPKATKQGGAGEEKTEPLPAKKKAGRKPYTEEQKQAAAKKKREKDKLRRQAKKAENRLL